MAAMGDVPVATGVALRVFLPFAAGYFMSYLFRTVNAVISPNLVADLGLTAADLGLLTSVYFLTFALFQLPLGMLLDRFGPRRVETGLLLFAGAGAALFALAESLEGLILGRALIGLGVSACLMGAFKAMVIWFPAERLPAVNGFIMTAGGLGALAATAPVEAALGLIDWRGLFLGLAVVTFGVAAALFLVAPERPGQIHGGGFKDQLRGVGQVFGSARFWRVAPLTMFSQAAFLSIQGLWAGPWLTDVAGLERPAVATHLLCIAAAMVAGYLLIGNLAWRLSRYGIPPIALAGGGMGVFMVAQLLLALGVTAATLPLWMLFGFFGTAGILPYAVLSQTFPAALAGRVNTAINLLVFVAAFASQWGIGAIIDLWPTAGGYDPRGYATAFGLVLGLQALAFVWFVMGGRRKV